MSTINCEACSELRENAPDFVQNGVTTAICNSLANDTGLNPNLASLHTDAEDLHNVNDCLIGSMDSAIEAYDVCDWKEYMHKFVPNLYEFNKAMICSLRGSWEYIHRLECLVGYLFQGTSFRVDEDPTLNSYVVAGKGISFYQVGDGELSSDIRMIYVAGGLLWGSGSLIFHQNDFTDAKACVNFDNGSVERTSTARLGNPLFNETGRWVSGGELLYEIRVKKSAYPQIATFFSGIGIQGNGGGYSVSFGVTDEGHYAYGQHGTCYSDGTPSSAGFSAGHLVPEGWVYAQVRMQYNFQPLNDGVQYTPHYLAGIRMNMDGITC